jgi:hypothetical protein
MYTLRKNTNIIKAANLIRRIRMAQVVGWNRHFIHLADQLEHCIAKMFEDVGD